MTPTFLGGSIFRPHSHPLNLRVLTPTKFTKIHLRALSTHSTLLDPTDHSQELPRRPQTPALATTTIMGKRKRTPNQGPIAPNPVPAHAFPVTLEDGTECTAVREGLATVLFPKFVAKQDKSGDDVKVDRQVFYNPIQQFNRDLSVLAIRAFGEVFLREKKAKKAVKMKRGEDWEGKESEVAAGDRTWEGVGGVGVIPETEGDHGKEGRDTLQERPMKANIPPKFTILDALSATGLRALRYALEIPFVTHTTSNDLDPSASQFIRRNIQFNKTHTTKTIDPALTPDAAMSKIQVETANATHHMYSVLSPPKPQTEAEYANGKSRERHFSKYDVIDLDPFGTAVPFLDAAVQAVSDGGLLCITCTDAGVWASMGYSEKCFSLYGGVPIKGEWSHEAGLRLILYATATAAARYGCSIEPLLSLSIDFYARVFVRVCKSPQEVKKLASTSMIVYNCDSGCGSWRTQSLGKRKEEKNKNGNGTYLKFGLAMAPTTCPECPDCGFTMHLGGPMWSGPMHSPTFITHLLSVLPAQPPEIYQTLPRITGMLQTALEESTLPNSPFFFVTNRLARTLHCEAPPLAAFRGALMRLGYTVVRSHCKPTSVKTDAPWSVTWEVMRRWVRQKSAGEGKVGEAMAGYKILKFGMKQNADNGEGSAREKWKAEKEKEEMERLTALEVVFDEGLGRDKDKMKGVVRYQVNPTANWGPLKRGRGVEALLGESAGVEEGDGGEVVEVGGEKSDEEGHVSKEAR
ncbi:N2,N2-dimethylguanosine tRNA methyltransferase-domain-containing protein [Tuber brumale]|nr:N2,N2-dimethylguanosine tRNA methyltransferase-domain-containing protein [Tuber brumale]